MPAFSDLARWINWQQPGGVISAGLHVVMLAAAVIGFSTTKPFQPAVEAAPVDVISESQFNEMMKGEKQGEKLPEPQQRADRQAEIKQQNDPGQAKRDVPVEPPKAELKAETPPPPPPLPPAPPVRPPVAAIQPPVRAPELRTRPMPPPEPEEEEEGEPIKQAAPKPPVPKPPEPKKIEPPKPQPDQVAILLREKEQQEARARAEAAAKAAEQKRIEDQKRKAEADAKAKAEADRRQREAREAAAKEKAARETAEADRLNDAIRNRLNASREAPASTGATAQNPSRQASVGAEQATGRRLSPSDRSRLVGILTEQMNRCLSIPPGVMPKSTPIITVSLGRDGAIIGGPTLTNPKTEPGYMPFAEANMRALRSCGPYRIPSQFLDMYESWKTLSIGVIPSAY